MMFMCLQETVSWSGRLHCGLHAYRQFSLLLPFPCLSITSSIARALKQVMNERTSKALVIVKDAVESSTLRQQHQPYIRIAEMQVTIKKQTMLYSSGVECDDAIGEIESLMTNLLRPVLQAQGESGTCCPSSLAVFLHEERCVKI